MSAGALDPTFGNGTGYVTTPVANYNGYGYTPLVQTDGSIIEVGTEWHSFKVREGHFGLFVQWFSALCTLPGDK